MSCINTGWVVRPIVHHLISSQNSLLDYFDTVNKLTEKKMQESSTTKLLMNYCQKKLSDDTGYWSDEMKKHFVNAPYWSIDKWISVLAKGGGQKRRFQHCLNPNYPHQFLCLRPMQVHSGSTINPALQDSVLLPEGFTEYIFSRRKRKRFEVNTSSVLHCCQSDG